jgi:hypothetical protein
VKPLRTKTKLDYREQLICSHKSLYEDEDKNRILSALNTHYPKMRTAYTLDWIPEQGEDIYTILVDLDMVATVEVDRLDKASKPFVDAIPIKQYQHKLSKKDQIKLSVALDLAQSEINGS